MKRLLIALCLMLLCTSAAIAEVAITGQPESQTVKAGEDVTFTVRASGVGRSAITWYFTDPATGEVTTGRKLSGAVKGVKVKNPNTLTITLQHVPEEMHGWTLYCHIGKKGAGVDSEEATIRIKGMDQQEDQPAEPENAGEKADDAEAETGTDAVEAAEPEEEPPEGGRTGGASNASWTGDGRMADIRGFKEDAEPQYQYLQLGTYYYEEDGTKAPLVWRVLSREGNISQLITEQVIDAMQMLRVEDYDTAVTNKRKFKSRYNTPYEETDLYFWLNGEMASAIFEEQDFSAAVVPHKITESLVNETDVPEEPGYQNGGSVEPLTAEEKERFPYGKDLFYIMTYADMKNGLFGFPKTHAGNTRENDGEKIVPESGRRKAYPTPYAAAKVQYPEWKNDTPHYNLDVVVNYKGMNYGGSSPYWAIKRRPNYYMSGIVGANGHLSWSNMASVRIGVRPAAIVDLSKLRVAGGSGTLEDPWVMEVAE